MKCPHCDGPLFRSARTERMIICKTCKKVIPWYGHLRPAEEYYCESDYHKDLTEEFMKDEGCLGWGIQNDTGEVCPRLQIRKKYVLEV